MEFWKIFFSSVAGTAAMTVFSYIMANIKNDQFKEPELLNKLLDSSTMISGNFSKNNVAGWLIHFSIGFAFIFLFSLLWNFTALDPSWLTAAGFGFVAGIIGVLGWETMFKLNSAPPDIQLKKFFVQLLFAHVIFALAAFLVYGWW
ncbi:MAG: hypothetical protein WBL27_03935 [Salinimicrobium sp.]